MEGAADERQENAETTWTRTTSTTVNRHELKQGQPTEKNWKEERGKFSGENGRVLGNCVFDLGLTTIFTSLILHLLVYETFVLNGGDGGMSVEETGNFNFNISWYGPCEHIFAVCFFTPRAEDNRDSRTEKC